MKIVVVYCYPLNGNHGRRANAVRFVDTYQRFPAQADHQLLVVSNGESPNADTRELFAPIPGVEYFLHDDSGWDIGAYQHVARDLKGIDMMVFFGDSVYLRRAGWLQRMAEVFQEHGNILYGSMQHSGAPPHIFPHVRTTGFWLKPELLLAYPILIHEPHQRYPFEHGPDSLTMFCAKNAGCGVATFDQFYWMNQWTQVVEGYHWGEQKQLLVGDRLTCPPHHPTP